jgi:hypothetical protein
MGGDLDAVHAVHAQIEQKHLWQNGGFGQLCQQLFTPTGRKQHADAVAPVQVTLQKVYNKAIIIGYGYGNIFHDSQV